MTIRNTKTVARLIGVNISTLSQAVWAGRIPEPQRGPGGCFLWADEDINRASRVLTGKAYHPQQTSEGDHGA